MYFPLKWIFLFLYKVNRGPRFRKPLKIRPFISLEFGLLHLFPTRHCWPESVHTFKKPALLHNVVFFSFFLLQYTKYITLHCTRSPRFTSLRVLIFSSKSQRLSTNTPRVGMLVADRTLFEKIKEQLTDMLQILSHTLKTTTKNIKNGSLIKQCYCK